MDITAKLKGIDHNINAGEYAIAAKECVGLVEQALRQLFRDRLMQLDEKDRLRVQDAERKKGHGKRGVDHFTMGQLVHLLRESQFLEAWERISDKDLTNLRVINLDELTRLRNKFIHEGRDATRSEAEFLVKCLHVILETFDIASLDKTSPVEAKLQEPRSQPEKPSTPPPAGRIIQHVGRDYIEHIGDHAHVVTGSSVHGNQPRQHVTAQHFLQTITPLSSKDEILRLLAFVQQELTRVPLPAEVKEEVALEVKGAAIQVKKEPPAKQKMAGKLHNAIAALQETGTSGEETMAVENLIGKAIEWGVN